MNDALREAVRIQSGHHTEPSEAIIYAAMVRLMLKRLAQYTVNVL